MKITLTSSQTRLVDRLMKSEGFESSKEVIGAGLRMLARQAKQRQVTSEDTRAKIAAGLRDVKEGRVVSGEKFFKEFRRLTDRLLKQQSAKK